MAFQVKAWYAKHTGGTKFYHVIRVISGHDNKSFAIEHYGRAEVFVDHDKAATGSITVRPPEMGSGAGLTKIDEKRKRDYLNDQELKDWNVGATRADLRSWLKARLGSKAYSDAYKIIDASFTDDANLPGARPPSAAAPEPPKGMLKADYDYGTW